MPEKNFECFPSAVNTQATTIATVVNLLRESVGVPFSIWAIPDNSEAWHLVHTEEGGDVATPPQLAPEAADEGPVRLQQLLDSRFRVEMLVQDGHQEPLAIHFERDSNEPELLRRLATTCHQHIASRLSVRRHETRIAALCEQVTDDLEEISLLREAAGRLELSNSSMSLAELASATLPFLQRSVRAESVSLLCEPAEKPAYMVGDAGVDESVCWRLVNEFGPQAQAQPVVKNRLNERPGHTSQPLRSFVLVPISKGERLFGWLLAVNRIVAESSTLADFSNHEFGTGEAGLLSALAAMFATQSSNIELFREKEALLVGAVRTLVSAIEAKDPYTCGHSERVAMIAKRLAEEIGLTRDECECVYLSGLLHDIGKINVPDHTLHKTSRLSEDEFEAVKRHPDVGWSILQGLDQLADVLPGVVHHHERFDGRGYPDRLVGEDIPLPGRILGVADAYDAMTSDRPYRAGMDQQQAVAILQKGSGTQWDPQLIDSFLDCLPEILEMCRTYQRSVPAARCRSSSLPALDGMTPTEMPFTDTT